MAADTAQDKKLPATQRRIDRARREGQVARSRDLAHLAVLGTGIATVAAFAEPIGRGLQRLLAQALRFDAALVAHPAGMGEKLVELLPLALVGLLGVGAVTAAVAVLTAVLAGGWNFTLQPLAPNFGKLNPIVGIGRVFSLAQLTDTLKACALALLLGAAAVLVLQRSWAHHAELLSMPLTAALAEAGRTVLAGTTVLGALLVAFALVDVPLQRWMLGRRLRMSITEVKQEYKEAEGHPELKARLKQRMRELAGQRMMAAVPGADLVVMNPTHYAVALKYDDATMAAPRVVAKGADALALRIRDAARAAGVPVLQAAPLARALYAHTELDREVPARLFAAVAQVLAWVYQLKRPGAAGGAVPPAPQPEVPPELDPANPAAQAAQAAQTGQTGQTARAARPAPHRPRADRADADADTDTDTDGAAP